jgi:hypothetical protein
VPFAAGPWHGTDVEVDPEPFQQTRAAAYWMRRYTKDGVDWPITVILMCGRADHMAIHTPDICYRGAGFDIIGDPVAIKVGIAATSSPPMTGRTDADGKSIANLWSARFRQQSRAAAQQLAIYWTWSADGNWQAPSSPRWTFAGESFLYKLYVVHDDTNATGREAVATEFIQHLLPVLDKSLFQ